MELAPPPKDDMWNFARAFVASHLPVPGLRRGPEFHAGFCAGPVASMMGVAGSGASHGVRTSMQDSMRDPASSYVVRHYVRPEFECCERELPGV